MKLAQTSSIPAIPADPTPAIPASANPVQAAPADPAALLETLRDIQLPDAVSWWPPAPGWWWLLGVALLAYLGWRYEWYARWRRARHAGHTPAPVAADAAARAEFERVRAAFAADGDVKALAVALSVLLRRVAMGFASRDEAAALTGVSWLEWLDTQVEGEAFSAGPGRVLADAPYRASADVEAEVDGDALLRVCEEWITAMFRTPPRGGEA